MAKFTSQEVNALQQGGNERVKEIFFKEWDSQRHSFPDSSNVDKLRTFIKHVYVDRRYAGERDVDRPPRVKGDREDYEQKRQDASAGGSRSPSYSEHYDRRYGEGPSSGGRTDDRNFRSSFEERRSPTYNQGDLRRSPTDDRYREDKSGNVQKNHGSEDQRIPDGMHKLESGSPKQKENVIVSPVVRLARDTSGETTPVVKIAEPPKPNGRAADNASKQLTATASNLVASASGKTVEPKTLNTASLIDFSTDIEPPVSHPESLPQTLPANGGDWASFDSSLEQKAAQVTATINPLDPTLVFHSVSADAPVSNATLPAVAASPFQAPSTFTTVQQNVPPLFPTSLSQSSIPSITQSIVGNTSNQSWAPNGQGIPRTLSAPEVLVPRSNLQVPNAQQNAEPSKPESFELKAPGRKELPADLFTALYPPAYAPVMAWQPHPNNFTAGYGMQYPMAVVPPAFLYPSKPANPFDIPNEATLTHASTFPSMASLQGALPDSVNSPGLMRTSSLGTTNPTQQWIPPTQPPQPPAFSGGFMGQPLQNNIRQSSTYMFPGGNQASVDITSQGLSFGPPGIMQQQLSSQFSQSGTNAYAPVSGNPFG